MFSDVFRRIQRKHWEGMGGCRGNTLNGLTPKSKTNAGLKIYLYSNSYKNDTLKISHS